MSKRPSISDVAETAGVSRAAVSKVIRNAYGVSPAMRERVEAAIEKLNYRPLAAARSLRGSSFTIGFEIPHLGNDFFNQVVSGTADSLAASNYQLMVAPGLGYRSATSVLDALLDRQMDGVITISSQVPAEWLENVALRVPLVLLGRHEQSDSYDTVTGDDVAGVNLVMDHLFDLGHRRITHLTLNPRPRSLRTRSGWRPTHDRMEQAGLEPEVAFAETEATLTNRPRPCSPKHGSRPPFSPVTMPSLSRSSAPSAISEETADISVVGYDNVDLARHPAISLTTVDQHGHDMGVVATGLLMERLRNGRTTSQHIQLEPQLRVRGSTRRILT